MARITLTVDFLSVDDAQAAPVATALDDYFVKLLAEMSEKHGFKAVMRDLQVTEDTTIVYTDGGAQKGGIGACAAIIQFPDGSEEVIVDTAVDTTNNRMELLAVIKALGALPIGPPIRIILDSEYVQKGLTEWCRNWVRNGWKTVGGKPVINKDLWEQLIKLYNVHTVSLELVKGHSGVPGNERADKLCTEAMEKLHKEILAHANA